MQSIGKLGHNAVSRPAAALPASSTGSTRQLLAKGAKAAEAILRAYPQADARVTEVFAAELTQFLATLTDQELGWVLDTRSGIKTRCKFLPTPADIAELVAEAHKARDFVHPGTSGYRKLNAAEEAAIAQPPGDQRKAQVRQLLGYDPAAPAKRVSRLDLVAPSASDLDALGKAVKLKPPAQSDATPQLKALLMQPNEERLT